MSTGFLGTPLILDALFDAGYAHDAMAMLRQRQLPSWLYPVTMGATTIWERWDSLLPDGRVHSGSMTSFNHYAYGAVADWMHRRIGGLMPAAPGYEEVVIRPGLDLGLESASLRHDTPYGEIAISWSIGEGGEVAVSLPFGVTASIELPDWPPVRVGAGEHRFAVHPAAHGLRSASPGQELPHR